MLNTMLGKESLTYVHSSLGEGEKFCLDGLLQCILTEFFGDHSLNIETLNYQCPDKRLLLY